MNPLGRALKSWEYNTFFSLAAWRQRMGRKRMWENKQPLPEKWRPWERARFQLRPGGVRNIM